MARVIGLLDMDYFFAQVEERENPSLKDKPVVVCVFSGRSSESGSVATCNYEARALGIRSAMPIFRAKQLAREKPETVFLPVRKPFYAEISNRIFALVEKAGAGVERVGLDEAYFDWSRIANGNFELARQKAVDLKREIGEAEKLSCSIGLGPSKLVAKMAAGQNKPNGLTVVLPSHAEVFLADFPVSKLQNVGPKTAQKLEEKGIRFVRDLKAISLEYLTGSFGRARGTFLFEACRGRDEAPVKANSEKKHFSRMATLAMDTADEKALRDHLQPLALDIEAWMAQRELFCQSVSLGVVRAGDLSFRSKSVLLEKPVRDAPVLLSAALLLAEKFRQLEPGVLFRRAGISVGRFSAKGKKPDDAQKGLTDFV